VITAMVAREVRCWIATGSVFCSGAPASGSCSPSRRSSDKVTVWDKFVADLMQVGKRESDAGQCDAITLRAIPDQYGLALGRSQELNFLVYSSKGGPFFYSLHPVFEDATSVRCPAERHGHARSGRRYMALRGVTPRRRRW